MNITLGESIMITNCPHCQKEINISTKQLNEYGLVINSKGDFISNLFDSVKGISLIDIMIKCESKYPNENSQGRILRVINQLKNQRVIYQKGNQFFKISETSK